MYLSFLQLISPTWHLSFDFQINNDFSFSIAPWILISILLTKVWVCGVSDTLYGIYIHLDIFNYHGIQVAVVSYDGRGTDLSNLENRTTLSYTGDASQSHNGSSSKWNSKSEELVPGKEMNGSEQDNSVSLSKKTAKIHDFCFGIPCGEYCLEKVEELVLF